MYSLICTCNCRFKTSLNWIFLMRKKWPSWLKLSMSPMVGIILVRPILLPVYSSLLHTGTVDTLERGHNISELVSHGIDLITSLLPSLTSPDVLRYTQILCLLVQLHIVHYSLASMYGYTLMA